MHQGLWDVALLWDLGPREGVVLGAGGIGAIEGCELGELDCHFATVWVLV